MVASESELAGLVSGTSLADFELGSSSVCEGEEPVTVIGPIPSAQAQESLAVARNVLDRSGRWPVWVPNFATVVGGSIFAELEFAAYAPPGAEITPGAMVERALAADETAMLRERANRYGYSLDDELQQWAEGHSPDQDAIAAAFERGDIPSVGEIERWVLDWQMEHVPEVPADTEGVRHHTLDYWHEEPDGHLFFLPTAEPWRATSYLNFFGSGGELSTLLLKKWFDKWGAVVVAHPGTMMNFEVSRPPTSPADAAEVAWEHYLLASCTTVLTGIGLHQYAWALIGHPRWSLHEKP